jgi:hypothetical protein
VWSRRLPPSCSLSPSALYGKDGDDTTVDVLSAACPTGGLVLAVSPADGRIRWSLHARAAIADAISVQHGITALWDGRTLQVRTADGRTLLRAEGDSLCGDLCQIVVAAGRVLLGYSPGRSTQLLRAVEVSSGRTAWSRQVATYQAMTEAGGRVYALSNALADGLLPAALDVIDPLSGQLTVVPLPLAFRSGAGDRPWLAAAGGLLLVGYPLEFAGPAGGYRVIALRSAPAGAGPVLLGGVSPADWPDACRLISGEELTTVIPAAGYKITPDRVVIAGLRLSAGCEYQSVAANGDAAEVDVSIGWVAVTARQAALLLADVRATYQEAEPLPRLGDEAYALGTPVGPVAVRVGRVIIVVSADQSPGATTELARFAVLRLRQRGS